MSDIRIGRCGNNDDRATIAIRISKADRVSECERKTLKAVSGQVSPDKALARTVTQINRPITSDEKLVGKWVRNRLCANLLTVGSEIEIHASRIRNRPIRSGGKTAMWREGYDIEVIKRRGVWKYASSQGYLRGGHLGLAPIGQRRALTMGNTYQFSARGETQRGQRIANSGREGGKGGQEREKELHMPHAPKSVRKNASNLQNHVERTQTRRSSGSATR